MNTNWNPENQDRLLRAWKVEAPLPPRFQERVWSRVAQAESRPEGSFWSTLASWLSPALGRPRIAVSYVTVLLALGIAAGSWTAQFKSSRMESALGQRYLQTVNPYQQVGLNP